MQTEYKRELTHSYMLLYPDAAVSEQNYELQMIRYNKIPGILPLTVHHLNQTAILQYEITGLTPLSVFCQMGKLKRDDLKDLLQCFLSSLSDAEEYLLNTSHLLLEPEKCYIRWESKELFLPYVPGFQRELRQSLMALMDYLMTNIQGNDQETVVFAYRIYHELQNENFQLFDLKQYLNGSKDTHLSTDPNQSIHMEEAVEAGDYSDRFTSKESVVAESVIEYRAKPKFSLFDFFFGKKKRIKQIESEVPEGTYISEEIEMKAENPPPPEDAEEDSYTMLLSSSPRCIDTVPVLEAVSENLTPEVFRLEGTDFLIGSREDFSDLVIKKTTVSRIHARIFQRGMQYFIMDLSSKNGTTVDGITLVGQEEVPLENGCLINFADCTYRFVQRSHLSHSAAN